MKLKKQIHDITTGEVIIVDETDTDVAAREARIADAVAREAAAEAEVQRKKDALANMPTLEEINNAKGENALKGILLRMHAAIEAK